MSDPRFVGGVHAFADLYHGFVLDQWGVLHDGQSAYPGVHEALAQLRRRDKRIVLLSNSSRRAEYSTRHLAALGFDPSMFAAIVTSGEAAWRILKNPGGPPFDRFTGRCFLITRDGDEAVLAGTGVRRVADVAEADFLFFAGIDSPARSVEDYQGALEDAARRELPALCSNPDLGAPSQHGIVLAPGALAHAYAELGGSVFYVGKPHQPIYGTVLETLEGLGPAEIVAVGDSLAHDIKGAKDAGLDAAFVTGGLHAGDFAPHRPAEEHRIKLAELLHESSIATDWVIPRFVW
jgi:HAD superfamily hydrolase (TIGR01459 family)